MVSHAVRRAHAPVRGLLASATVVAIALVAPRAAALDKQSSAHGGHVDGPCSGVNFSGSVLAGIALHNPTFAARPDNSGLGLLRFAPHVDLDLIGHRLSLPIDVNLWTDRKQRGASQFRPSELDIISGLTSTWPVGLGAVELGVRFERDMPVDQKGLVQTYGDTRLRYLYSAASYGDLAARALRGGDVSGAFTLGWFSYNKSYAARPDNSGTALLRYGSRTELSAFDRKFAVAVDVTVFTDRSTAGWRPSEMDWTPELIARHGPVEIHLMYERDMPLDRAGLVQQIVLMHVVWGFDFADLPASSGTNATAWPIPIGRI